MTDEAKALVANLRDEDSYYRIQEKHWCIDGEELERQRLAAADLIETQAREIERLNAILSEMNDRDVIARTMAENERLREALEFYANNKNYRYIIGVDCTSVDIDAGDTARAALAGDSHDQ